jgi:hypothetical protein
VGEIQVSTSEAPTQIVAMTVLRAMRSILKRWWFWTAAILLLLGIGAGGLFIYAGQSKIAQANFDRIQKGMTRAEVREILGKKTGVIISGSDLFFWIDGPTMISIYFADDFVELKRFVPGTVWERIKHSLGKCLPKSLTRSY